MHWCKLQFFSFFLITLLSFLALNIIEFITDCVVRYLTRASWSVPRVCSSNEDKIRTSRLYTVKCETAQIIWEGKRKSERGRETDRQTTQWKKGRERERECTSHSTYQSAYCTETHHKKSWKCNVQCFINAIKFFQVPVKYDLFSLNLFLTKFFLFFYLLK